MMGFYLNILTCLILLHVTITTANSDKEDNKTSEKHLKTFCTDHKTKHIGNEKLRNCCQNMNAERDNKKNKEVSGKNPLSSALKKIMSVYNKIRKFEDVKIPGECKKIHCKSSTHCVEKGHEEKKTKHDNDKDQKKEEAFKSPGRQLNNKMK